MTDKEFILRLRADISQYLGGMQKAHGANKSFIGSITKGVAMGNLLSGAVTKIGSKMVDLAMDVAHFDDKMRRMQVDSSLSTAEMLKLKDQILSTGIATGTSSDEMASLASNFLKTSKDLPFVNEQLGFAAKLMSASGISGEELGKSLGELREETGLTGKEFQDMISRLYSFSKQKGVRMSFAELMPRAGELVETFKAINPKASTAQLADYMTTSMFVGKPEAVMKAYSAMLTPKTRKFMRDQLGMDLSKGVPPLSAILTRLRAIPNDSDRAGAALQVFGRGSGIAMLKMVNDVDAFNSALQKVNPKALSEDSETMAKGFTGAMNKLNGIVLKFSDSALAPSINEITKAISDLDPAVITGLSEAFVGLSKAILGVTKGVTVFIAAWTDMITGTQGDIFDKNMRKAEQNFQAGKEIALATRYKKEGRIADAEAAMERAHRILNPELVDKQREAQAAAMEKRVYRFGPQSEYQNQGMPMGRQTPIQIQINNESHSNIDGDAVASKVIKKRTTVKNSSTFALTVLPQSR